MDNEEKMTIEQIAEEIHEEALQIYSELVKEKVYGDGVDFTHTVTMDDLYNADKLGYVVYRTIYSPQNDVGVTPFVADLRSIWSAIQAVDGPTIDEVDQKIMELGGTVIQEEHGVGTLVFPVLPIISVSMIGGEKVYMLGPHGVCGSVTVGFAMSTVEVYAQKKGK